MPAPTRVLRALDALDATVGPAVCTVLGAAAQRGPAAPLAPGAVRRLLVIRPGGLGDAVLAVPLLRALRRRFHDARIDVLMERRNAALVPDDVADRVLLYDRGELWSVLRGGYDAVVDTEQSRHLSAVVARLTRAPVVCGFATNRRRRLLTHPVAYDEHAWEPRAFLALYEALAGEPASFDDDAPWLAVADADRAWAAAALAPLGARPLAALAPGAPLREREWAAARWAEVGRRLVGAGWGVVLVGGAADRAACVRVAAAIDGTGARHARAGAVIDLAGRATLRQSAAALARAAVYVSTDGGLLHVAHALGAPTVALFGATSAAKWAPRGQRTRTIAHALPCAPCTRFARTPPCPYGVECLARVTVDEVVAAVHEVARA
jgi:lipopolysaccharide heptosyltransferase II